MELIKLKSTSESKWFGMRDCQIELEDSGHIIELKYISEPPHGDSYHELRINNKLFQGYVWGCMFLFPYNQEFMVCQWMEKLYQRRTIIVNLCNLDYHVFNNSYSVYEFDEVLLFGNYRNEEKFEVNIDEIVWINSMDRIDDNKVNGKI